MVGFSVVVDGGGLPGNGANEKKKWRARVTDARTYTNTMNCVMAGNSCVPRRTNYNDAAAARAMRAYSYAAHAATMFFRTFFTSGNRSKRFSRRTSMPERRRGDSAPEKCLKGHRNACSRRVLLSYGPRRRRRRWGTADGRARYLRWPGERGCVGNPLGSGGGGDTDVVKCESFRRP